LRCTRTNQCTAPNSSNSLIFLKAALLNRTSNTFKMDNTYFVFADNEIIIERFHICTWEFTNSSALIEIGCEISEHGIKAENNQLTINLNIPWLNDSNSVVDLCGRLTDPANSKFIFNDSVKRTVPLDDGRSIMGVIHEFELREPLCILPVVLNPDASKKKIEVAIDLTTYSRKAQGTNIYFRFLVNPAINSISTRKKGVSRSTIIYDVKVNERRNIPDYLFAEINNKKLCTISSCFCFNIVPNSYDLSFFDSSSLINVRTLEYESFNRYLADKRVKKDELMVVFNKKEKPHSFAFFSIFCKERIGAGQFALAVLINLISGILLFLPTYRKENHVNVLSRQFWSGLPSEVYLAIFIGLLLITYFAWPLIAAFISVKLRMGSQLKRRK
jgi:hypothetical protein